MLGYKDLPNAAPRTESRSSRRAAAMAHARSEHTALACTERTTIASALHCRFDWVGWG